jgi:hypothetical protein
MLMITLLTTAFVLAQGDGRIVTTAPPAATRPAPNVPAADAEPEMITRGRTTTIVVKGADVEVLKTLGVSPPDGVKLGEIKVLPAGKDGRKAVSVAVTVDANAKPGERDLTLIVAPNIVGTGARAGDDEAAKQMEKMMQEIIKRETKAQPAGTLHINSHDVKITKVDFVGGKTDGAARITVEDEAGDLVAGTPVGGEAKGELGIVQIAEPVASEAHCGDETFYAVLTESSIQEKKPPSVVLQAGLDTQEIQGKSGCELRVRVEDKAGNVSPWFATKLELR